jgi:hypothetical protein
MVAGRRHLWTGMWTARPRLKQNLAETAEMGGWQFRRTPISTPWRLRGDGARARPCRLDGRRGRDRCQTCAWVHGLQAQAHGLQAQASASRSLRLVADHSVTPISLAILTALPG